MYMYMYNMYTHTTIIYTILKAPGKSQRQRTSAAQRQIPHRQNEPQIGKRMLSSSTRAKPYETLMLLHTESKNKKVCRKRTQKQKNRKVPKISFLPAQNLTQLN